VLQVRVKMVHLAIISIEAQIITNAIVKMVSLGRYVIQVTQIGFYFNKEAAVIFIFLIIKDASLLGCYMASNTSGCDALVNASLDMNVCQELAKTYGVDCVTDCFSVNHFRSSLMTVDACVKTCSGYKYVALVQ